MKSIPVILTIAVTIFAIAGCKPDDGALPAEARAAAASAKPVFASPLKSGGGMAMLVGPKPPGSVWKTGPPDVGGKLKN